MKRNLRLLAIFALIPFLAGILSACSKSSGFKEDQETGIQYKFYVENKDAPQPVEGDLIDFIYVFRTADSVIVEARPMQDIVQPSRYKGDIYAVYKMIHLGDSATFILDGEAFFQNFVGQEFDFENKELYVDMKLTKITSKAELDEMRSIQMEQAETLRLVEDSILVSYITKNNIKVKPSESGLYYISQKAGKGKKAENGKLVSVHYTGKLLDGTVFDSSLERGEPIQFQLGTGMVIPGWEEGIALMHEGGKAILVMPSSIAYGGRAAGPIPPYSPLVFEVELITVNDAPLQNNLQ